MSHERSQSTVQVSPAVLLMEPSTTPFDVNFTVFGFPVRVSAWFWLTALLMGGAAYSDGSTLIIWLLVVFLSILIHELGHAFAFRFYGMNARIVLYQFGGLAVPDGYGSPWNIRSGYRDPRHDIVISLAGPFAQLAAAALIVLPFWLPMLAQGAAPRTTNEFWQAVRLQLNNPQLLMFLWAFVTISVYWALLNLLPVYPLDGGQVARQLFLMFSGNQGIAQSLWLSVITGAVVALYGFQSQSPFLGLMFLMLAYSSYTAVSQYGGWR